MALNSPVSEELIRTGQWIQDNRGELASPQTAGLWSNSNITVHKQAKFLQTQFCACNTLDSTDMSLNEQN